MSILLGEPFLLASYPTPSQKYPYSVGAGNPKSSRHLSVTCSSRDNGEGFATVSVQGDGIHALELSNMHTAVSHTLGPSALFAAPAVTRFDGPNASTSYAIMQSAADGIEAEDRGRTVWRWRDNQSRRPDEPLEPKSSAVLPQLVEKIWAPSGLPSHVITVSPTGSVMLIDDALNTTSSDTMADTESILLKGLVFEQGGCTFLPHGGDQPRGMVVVCFVMIATQLKLRITLAQLTGELTEVTECDLGIRDEGIADISCDPSGYTSVLTQQGRWYFYRLNHESATLMATTLDLPIHLTSLFISSSTTSNKSMLPGPTIISVGSSYVLLAGISGGSHPEIVLLLWDIKYSVVLASQKIVIPSTVAYSLKSPPILELVPASRNQALLALSPAITKTGKHTISRSTVFIIPLGVPRISTIALAMGKAQDTQKWLQNTHSPPTAGDDDEEHRQVLQSVRQLADQCHFEAAETAFFAWVEDETIRLGQSQRTAKENVNELDSDGEARIETGPNASRGTSKQKKGVLKPALSYRFVSDLLEAILQPSKSPHVFYSSKIVYYLVNRKAVSNAMVQGGLLPALRYRRDWNAIVPALRTVRDLPEADVIQLLADVATSHRQHDILHSNDMQVDTPSDAPSLARLLAVIVECPMSPPMLRLALKLHLPDVVDIVHILEILEGWLAWWCGKPIDAGLDDVPTDGTHARRTRKKSSEKPPLEFVISFIQSLLDAHFLTLLQHSPCHGIIERTAQHLQHQMASVDDLDRLRRPLEAFVRAGSQKARMQHATKDGGGDWRKRRKEASEAAELAIGLYQIEELVI